MGALRSRKLGVATYTCSPKSMTFCWRVCSVFVEFLLCFEAVFELKRILIWEKMTLFLVRAVSFILCEEWDVCVKVAGKA
jgi:hypothetical protein